MDADGRLRILHLVAYPLFSGPIPPTFGLAQTQARLGHRVSLAFDRKRGAFNDFEEAAAPPAARNGLVAPRGADAVHQVIAVGAVARPRNAGASGPRR